MQRGRLTLPAPSPETDGGTLASALANEVCHCYEKQVIRAVEAMREYLTTPKTSGVQFGELDGWGRKALWETRVRWPRFVGDQLGALLSKIYFIRLDSPAFSIVPVIIRSMAVVDSNGVRSCL